ncbi:MAG: arsenate reductase family protein [Verrucomicrobiae bacterium]|nr:arsenate reductase family protein [Verrucomicrobiae bacterium]
MMLKLYVYHQCSTCRNAMKWLKTHHIPFQDIPIRETPPSLSDLKTMLKARDNNLRSLFNTSGQDYRAQGLKEKLENLSIEEALTLLNKNGNLVKRPFVLDPQAKIFLVGFREAEWKAAFKK